MNVSIFGLGYVGCIGLGCLAELGHSVIGVDLDENKINLVNEGKATIVEKDIDEMIKRHHAQGTITATRDVEEAVLLSEISMICVGTPNLANGDLDMSHIFNVVQEIGKALCKKSSFHTIVIRSTVMPGTNRTVSGLLEEISGKKNDADFAVVSNPEFLREGSAVHDFFDPPYTVIASDSSKGTRIVQDLYEKIPGETIVTGIGIAELIKFVNNSFHGLKVVFANEIGRICKSLGIDSRELMELFVKDKVLNISPYYFRPGFSYGGSCLPKDLAALNSISRTFNLSVPVLSAVDLSNKVHLEYAVDKVVKEGKRKIGLSGLSFKSGTDDLRFSPALELAERLIGKGYSLKIYDENVHLSRLLGKNKEFLFSRLPHINEILCESLEIFLTDIELLIINNRDQEILRHRLVLQNKKLKILDLSGTAQGVAEINNYEGICW